MTTYMTGTGTGTGIGEKEEIAKEVGWRVCTYIQKRTDVVIHDA